MTFETVFEDLSEIVTKDGGTVRVVQLKYPHLVCWFREYYWSGNEIRYKALGEAVCGTKHLDEFRVSDLKKDQGIWKQLNQEQQTGLEARGVIEEKESRPGRKPKEERVESETGSEVVTEPQEPREPHVAKRRGRQANPLNAGIPKKLHCQVCNRNLGTSPDQFRTQVQKSGLSQEEFVAGYRCRGCRKVKEAV